MLQTQTLRLMRDIKRCISDGKFKLQKVSKMFCVDLEGIRMQLY